MNLKYIFMYDEIKLAKRVEQEQHILNTMRPTSKLYQKQYQLVKQLKAELESIKPKENRARNRRVKKQI